MINLVNNITNYNKDKKTGDLDIVDKIKLRGSFPKKYKKTGDLDIVDKIKLYGSIPKNYKKKGTLIYKCS